MIFDQVKWFLSSSFGPGIKVVPTLELALIHIALLRHGAGQTPAAGALVVGPGGREEDNRLVLPRNSRDVTVEFCLVHNHDSAPAGLPLRASGCSELFKGATSRACRLVGGVQEEVEGVFGG